MGSAVSAARLHVAAILVALPAVGLAQGAPRVIDYEALAAETMAVCQQERPSDFQDCAYDDAEKRIPNASVNELVNLKLAIDEKRLAWVQKRVGERIAASKEACRKRGMRYGVVKIGMHAKTASECGWGPPSKVNRTTTARGTTEQWIYDRGYLYFTNGVLTAIQD